MSTRVSAPFVLPILLFVLMAGIAAVGREQASDFDLLLLNGRIVDGTGAPWYRGDVGVKGDRIAAIGRLGDRTAVVRVDANDLVIAPGFIDMLGQSEFNVLVDPRAASKVMMGVTSEITGEGQSIGPITDRMAADAQATWDRFKVVRDFTTLGGFFERLEQRSRPALNMGSFVGAGGVRNYVIGLEDRPATPADLEQMTALVERAMEEGALGLSSSLQYVPDRFASTEELIALARAAARHGGVYLTHQRSESGRIDESMDEVFRIAREARIPAEIWHFKTAYKANWGRMPAALARLEAARAEGLDVTADIYPYTRASNGLDAALPLWVREGGADKEVARLEDPAQRERIRREMDDPAPQGWENQWFGSGGGDGILVSEVLDPALKRYEGKTMTEIARAEGKDPRDALMDLVVADHANTGCIIAIMREDDVRAALAHRLVSIGTDSGARAEDGPLAGSKSHPRGWGSFARILGTYVRDEKLLTLEDAVRKMTSLPARRVGLQDRGLLRVGMMADITVFDPATIADRATYEDPNHYAAGVRTVVVNGQIVVADGRQTDARPGRPLRGPGYRPSR